MRTTCSRHHNSRHGPSPQVNLSTARLSGGVMLLCMGAWWGWLRMGLVEHSQRQLNLCTCALLLMAELVRLVP